MDGFLVNSETLNRLDRALPRVERGRANAPNLSPWQVPAETRWVVCFNASFTTEIPGYSVCRQTSVMSGEGMPLPALSVMSTSIERLLYVTGPEPIAPRAFGVCSQVGILEAKYDPTDGTPSRDELWGPASAGFKLRKHYPGFRILQTDSAREVAYCTYEPPTALLVKFQSGSSDKVVPPSSTTGYDVWIGTQGAEFNSNLTLPSPGAVGKTYWRWPRFNAGSPLPDADWFTVYWHNNRWHCAVPNYPIIKAKATANWKGNTIACTLMAADGTYTGPAVTANICSVYTAGLPAPNMLANDEFLVCLHPSEAPNYRVIEPLIDAAIGTVRMQTNTTVPRGWGLMDGTANSSGNGGSGYSMTNLFPRAMTSVGSTGGADTHTHTIGASDVGTPSTTQVVQSGTGATVAADTHKHTINVQNGSTLPAYRGLYFIERLNNAAP